MIAAERNEKNSYILYNLMGFVGERHEQWTVGTGRKYSEKVRVRLFRRWTNKTDDFDDGYVEIAGGLDVRRVV